MSTAPNRQPNDPTHRSFVEVDSHSHFPIQNLPFGIFSTQDRGPRPGVAIGSYIFDLAVAEARGLLPKLGSAPVFDKRDLNAFIELGRTSWTEVRAAVSLLLDAKSPLKSDSATFLVPMQKARMHLPVRIGDYTDFYSSYNHAYNVGVLFRGPENAIQPNWLHMPIGYHGRASTVGLHDDVIRPRGQISENGKVSLEPSRKLDFELEMGFIVGRGNERGQPIQARDARDHIFGLTIVNDWSARDIQAWEYVPLGPFLGKNFQTSMSPWIVTLDALEPFRCADQKKELPILDYLKTDEDWNYDIKLEVHLKAKGAAEQERISLSNFKNMYWSMAQQLAHHSINGCQMKVGDLLASGTISGPTRDSLGCLLEMTRNGKEPLTLRTGGSRSFLEDGDELSLTAFCQKDGGPRIGFGSISQKVLPAL